MLGSVETALIKILINQLKLIKIKKNVDLSGIPPGQAYLAVLMGHQPAVEGCIRTALEILHNLPVSQFDDLDTLKNYIKHKTNSTALFALVAGYTGPITPRQDEEKIYPVDVPVAVPVRQLFSEEQEYQEILQSAAGKKEKNKIISSLPSDGSSNPIASFNNFCKYTLRLNPIWDIQPPNETESQFIVTIKFFDQVILKARDARKKYAMEIAATDAIELLNSNGKGENLLNQLAHYAVIAKNKALYNAENIFRKYVYFDVIGMRRKEYPAVTQEELEELFTFTGMERPENFTTSQIFNLSFPSVRACILSRQTKLADILALPELTADWLENIEQEIKSNLARNNPSDLQAVRNRLDAMEGDANDCMDAISLEMLFSPVRYEIEHKGKVIPYYLNQNTIKALPTRNECPFTRQKVIFNNDIDLDKVAVILNYCIALSESKRKIDELLHLGGDSSLLADEKVHYADLPVSMAIHGADPQAENFCLLHKAPDYQSPMVDFVCEKIIEKCLEAKKRNDKSVSIITIGRCYDLDDIVSVINSTKVSMKNEGAGRGCVVMLSRGDTIDHLVSRLLKTLENNHEDPVLWTRRNIMNTTINVPVIEVLLADYSELGWVNAALRQDFTGYNPSKDEFRKQYIEAYPLRGKYLMEMAFLCYCQKIKHCPEEARSFNYAKLHNAVKEYLYEQGLDLRCINNKQLKNILSNDFFTGIRTEIVENINLLQGRNSSDNHLNDQAQSVVLLNLFAHSISRALKKEKLENYCHLILYGSSEAFYNLAKSRHVIAATKSQDNEAAIFEEEEYKKHTGISPCIGVRICPEQSNELANVIICPEINSAADVRKKARDLVVRDWVNKAVTPAVSTQGHAALFGGALRRQEETGSQYNFDYKRG